MSTYKIHLAANGTVKGYGPNTDAYQPLLVDGDKIELVDDLPDAIFAADKIKLEISALESHQTPRRLREAALTDEGRAWLQSLEDQIEGLRVELAKLG